MAGGRPPIYSQKLADDICERLVNGDSMRTICLDNNMPCLSSVFKWLRENKEFSQQYEEARVMQAEALADELMDIADDSTNDYMEKKDSHGGSYSAINPEAIGRSRLRVDARKWYLSKVLPKFNDKSQIEHSGQVSSKLTVFEVQGVSAEDGSE